MYHIWCNEEVPSVLPSKCIDFLRRRSQSESSSIAQLKIILMFFSPWLYDPLKVSIRALISVKKGRKARHLFLFRFLYTTTLTFYPLALHLPEIYEWIPEWTTKCFRRLEYSAKAAHPWASQRKASLLETKNEIKAQSFDEMTFILFSHQSIPVFNHLLLIYWIHTIYFNWTIQQVSPQWSSDT